MLRKELFFPKGGEEENIISTEKPISNEHKKKVILNRGIKKEEYDEVYMFLRDENQMSSGNYTLLPKSEIERYSQFNMFGVLMKSQINNSLIGTILSIPFPIRCEITAGCVDNEDYTKEKIITHGCTTFLNVQTKIRGFGMCMLLIKELALYAYENDIKCSYQMTSFKLCENSFQISAFYRPINLINSVSLGFVFPGFNEINKFSENRMKYTNKIPKEYSVKRVLNKNLEKAFNFYCKLTADKKFVFYPDIKFFDKWSNHFPTFLVYHGKKIVGIFSINTIYCRMLNTMDGQLCLPLLFASKNEEIDKTLKCLFSVAADRNFDAVYMYSIGDLNEKKLKEVNCIKTSEDSWFSLYNNGMSLKPSDLYVPIF
jgi:hypothetical protein